MVDMRALGWMRSMWRIVENGCSLFWQMGNSIVILTDDLIRTPVCLVLDMCHKMSCSCHMVTLFWGKFVYSMGSHRSTEMTSSFVPAADWRPRWNGRFEVHIAVSSQAVNRVIGRNVSVDPRVWRQRVPAFPSPVSNGSVERTRRHTDEWQPNQQLRGGVEPALWSAGRAPASDYMPVDWNATSRCSWSPYDDLAPSPGKPWPQTTATCDTAAPTKSLCVMSGISRQKAYHCRLSIRRWGADSGTTLTWANSIYFCVPLCRIKLVVVLYVLTLCAKSLILV